MFIKKNIANITHTMIQDEIDSIQTNLANINTLSPSDKLSQVNISSVYNDIIFTTKDILSDQSIGYWQMIDSVSSWLASPIIGMLNLVSGGFTCDINEHVKNINKTVTAYTHCIFYDLYKTTNIQFQYVSNYSSDYHFARNDGSINLHAEGANYNTINVLDARR